VVSRDRPGEAYEAAGWHNPEGFMNPDRPTCRWGRSGWRVPALSPDVSGRSGRRRQRRWPADPRGGRPGLPTVAITPDPGVPLTRTGRRSSTAANSTTNPGTPECAVRLSCSAAGGDPDVGFAPGPPTC